MGLAAQLLRNPSTLIATVADKVGYGSDVAFYRAFRRHFGQSPGAFRLAQSGVPGLNGAASQAGSAAASVRNPGTMGIRHVWRRSTVQQAPLWTLATTEERAETTTERT